MFSKIVDFFDKSTLVMLDVDGVLNPTGTIDNDDDTIHQRVEGKYGTWFLNQEDGEWLREFQKAGATLLWQTMWAEEATQYINPFFGIKDVDYITYPTHATDADGKTYKFPQIKEHAGKHSLVIIDDDMKDDLKQWSRTREYPTLIIQTKSHIGWTNQDKQDILDFIKQQNQ